jgi:hypothetical protein
VTHFVEYATLDDLRKSSEGAQLSISSNAADPFLLQLIREVSAQIDASSNRTFAPYVATQHYDALVAGAWSMGNLYYAGGRAGDVFQSRTGGFAQGRILRIDTDDLLEVTSLTNGDGTAIAASSYNLYPANVYPKQELHLVHSSGVAWLPDSNGNYEQVIALTGVFGYHTHYTGNSAWGGAGTVADAAGINASVTSYTASAASGIEAGMLLKIDSEFLYASAVSGTTVTIERGVNGSTAAIHATGTAVSFWRPVFSVQRITRMGAASLWNLRANPEGKQVSINGVTFATPNSVMHWVDNELELAGLQRIGLG